MSEKRYIGYEYKEVSVPSEEAPFYLDCYESFGWSMNENFTMVSGSRLTTLHLKRDRKLINKMELTRLQQHFEACTREIAMLEKSKTSAALALSLTVAITGTAFMAGSTFAACHQPPIVWLCILLAVPGFLGWLLPLFLYHWTIRRKSQQLEPLVEAKREEIYEICEKGHSLLLP